MAIQGIAFVRRWSIFRRHGSKLSWHDIGRMPYRLVAAFEIADEAAAEKQEEGAGGKVTVPEGFFLEELS